MVNAATHSLEGDTPGGPGGRARGGPGNDFARSIGFFSCGFAARRPTNARLCESHRAAV